MIPLKRQIRARLGPSIQWFGYSTGAMQVAASLRRARGAVILMYHSIAEGKLNRFVDPRNHVPADVFEAQVAFLAKHRTVVSLTDLVDRVRRSAAPAGGVATITFDDGYLDNLTTAAPILARYGLPATLFLPTGYIDRAEPQWVDQAYTAFEFRSVNTLAWNGDDDTRTFDLNNDNERHQAYRTVCAALLNASPTARCTMLDTLHEQLAPIERASGLTMSWDDVRSLIERYPGFEIGGHTVEHTSLTDAGIDATREELRQCSERIEAETGRRPRHFSFPYGRTSPELRKLVAEAGFESACGGGGGESIVRSTTDRYAIPRVEAPATMKRFDLLTSDANTDLWRRLGR